MAILFVVGRHFHTMGPAHGPLIAALGVLTTINAPSAFAPRPSPGRSSASGFGPWMFLAYPAFTYA